MCWPWVPPVATSVARVTHVQQAFADQAGEPSVPADALAALISMETGGELTSTQAKTVLDRLLVDGGGDPASIAAELGFEAMDTGELEAMVDDAIAAQPDAWEKFNAGENKAMGALVGQIMKASRGQADGKLVTEILHRKRGS